MFVELNFDIWSASVNCTFAEEERSVYLLECELHWSSFFPPSLAAISMKHTHGEIVIQCLPIQNLLTAESLQNMSITIRQVTLACTWGSRGKTAVWPVRKLCQTPSVGGSPQAMVMTHRHTALSQPALFDMLIQLWFTQERHHIFVEDSFVAKSVWTPFIRNSVRSCVFLTNQLQSEKNFQFHF